MEYRIFLKNYYRRLPRLLLFNLLFLGGLCLNACQENIKKKEPIIPTELKITSFYENGKTKGQEVYAITNGKRYLKGYKELHENGSVKMEGEVDEHKSRTGIWKSFYDDGKPWSIGEFDKGIEIGEKKTWYPDGKIRYQGQMEAGTPIGTWFFWDEQGNKTEKTY